MEVREKLLWLGYLESSVDELVKPILPDIDKTTAKIHKITDTMPELPTIKEVERSIWKYKTISGLQTNIWSLHTSIRYLKYIKNNSALSHSALFKTNLFISKYW